MSSSPVIQDAAAPQNTASTVQEELPDEGREAMAQQGHTPKVVKIHSEESEDEDNQEDQDEQSEDDSEDEVDGEEAPNSLAQNAQEGAHFEHEEHYAGRGNKNEFDTFDDREYDRDTDPQWYGTSLTDEYPSNGSA